MKHRLMVLYYVFLAASSLCAAMHNHNTGTIISYIPPIECNRIQPPPQEYLSCTVASRCCLRTKDALEKYTVLPQEIIIMMLSYLPRVQKMKLHRNDDPSNPLELLYWEHVGGPTCYQVRAILQKKMPFDISIYYHYDNGAYLLDAPPYLKDDYILQVSKNYKIVFVQKVPKEERRYGLNKPQHLYML